MAARQNDTRKNIQDEQGLKTIVPVVQILLLMFAYLGVALAGKSLLGEDFSSVMLWWGTLVLLGISCLPLTGLLFSGYHDGGFLFSKAIGLAIGGWLLWVLSSLHLLKFTRTGAILVVIVVFLFNLAGMVLIRKNDMVRNWTERVRAKASNDASKKAVLAMFFELLFLALFIAACYIKTFKPEAYGTEKFMDYGFMTSMMRTEYFPPEDFWFSGTYLNYYYVGQYFATFLTKLSGVTVNVGHNLALAMVLAFCFMLVYSIVYEVMQVTVELRNKKRMAELGTDVKLIPPVLGGIIAHAAGALAGTAVTFAGNMHYTIFAKIVPAVQEILGMDVDSYWFPDATRYIGYNPDTNDKTIHEFPAYSFVLGDLHAHVTNIMFVLTVLGILFAWLLYRRDRMEAVKAGTAVKEPYSRWLEAFHPSILVVGFFIGLFQMTNYWDFPIYYVVAGAVILFSNAVIHKFEKETLILTAIHGVLVLGISLVVSLLFSMNFDSMAGGIAICLDHTPFYQLMVLWGLPFTVLIMYFASLLSEKSKAKYDRKKGAKPLLFQFINRLELPELFILTIGLCAAGLILMPELVYVVDIYGGHKRANTMFKLTYQGFIMFGMMMGYVITKFVLLAKNGKQIAGGILTGFLLLGTVGYLGKSIESWFGNINPFDSSAPQVERTLDSAAFVWDESEYDGEAVDWINENIEGTPILLEANGDSYTYGNRVSVLTGLPTVLGWFTHEWLWKDDYNLVNERSELVKTMYTSTDTAYVASLLEEHNVAYIYIGGEEHKKYADVGGVNEAGLLSLGEVVFQNEGVKIIKVNQ